MSKKHQSMIPELTEAQKKKSFRGTVGQHQLHILSKKSWHVWNRENLERVEKDEEMHKKSLETGENREKEIKNEKKLQKLRENAKIEPKVNLFGRDGHINLFHNAQAQPQTEEKAKPARDDKFYLGQTSLDHDEPWYKRSHRDRSTLASEPAGAGNSFYPKRLRSKDRVKNMRQRKIEEADPLNEVKDHFLRKNRAESISSANAPRASFNNDWKDAEEKRLERRMQYQRERRERLRAIEMGEFDKNRAGKNDPADDVCFIDKKTDRGLIALRKERLVREERERERVRQLLREKNHFCEGV